MKSKMKAIFAERIKTLRENGGYGQRGFAKALTEKTGRNFSRQNVSSYENGTSYPSVEVLFDYAELLGITLNELFGKKPTKEAFRKIDLRKKYEYGYKRKNLRGLMKPELEELTVSLYNALDDAHKELEYLKNYMIREMMKNHSKKEVLLVEMKTKILKLEAKVLELQTEKILNETEAETSQL